MGYSEEDVEQMREQNKKEQAEEKPTSKAFISASSWFPLLIAFLALFLTSYSVILSSGSVIDFINFIFNGHNTANILLIFSAIILFIFITNSYLNKSGKIEASHNKNTEIDANSINKAVNRLEYLIDKNRSEFNKKIQVLHHYEKNKSHDFDLNLDEDQKKDLFNTINSSISRNLTNDFFKNLKNSIRQQLVEDKREQIFFITSRSESSIARLRSEIEILSRRANINLLIGSTIAIAALILLGYFVNKENFDSSDIPKTILHFAPRLSLAIFIELFALFFLKLYRNSLGEIKYYQNELTNLESKFISIIVAINHGDKSDISEVIKAMSSTERNFKLEKGQTTAEIEKNRLETHDLKEIIKSFILANKKDK